MWSLLSRFLPVVHADSAALHAVGTDLTPLAEGVPDIRMAAERVEISLFVTMAVVEATFDLANDGAETTIPVGFPAYGRPGPLKSTEAGMGEFQASVDGVPLAHVRQRLDNVAFPAWLAWQQTFPAHSTTRLAVRYWTPLIGYAGASRLPFIYVLRTGRFWKGGRIGAVDVIVRAVGLPFSAIREAVPEGYEFDPGASELRWSLRDHVPEQDIGLLISPLEILAHELGQRVLDPHDVREAAPPDGTRVTVAGTPTFQPFAPVQSPGFLGRLFGAAQEERSLTGWLMGERRQDRNIVVPDGIAPIEGGDEATMLRLIVRPEVKESRREVASYHRGWWKALVSGVVARDEQGLYLDVDEWTFLELKGEPGAKSVSVASRFPWVTGTWVSQPAWDAYDRPPSQWRGTDKPGSEHAQWQMAQWKGDRTRPFPGVRARVPHDE